MANEIFKKYYSKLAKEGFVKGLLCGLIIGLAVLFVMATAFWFFGYENTWLLIAAFVVVTGVSTFMFYRFKFRPTTKAIAKRVDALGLEERLLTMTQLEGDNSYIAMRQREDALNALSKVNTSLLKWTVSVPLIVAVSVCAVAAGGMTGVYAAYASDAIGSGVGIIEEANTPAPVYYNINYKIDGVGKIELLDADGNVIDWIETSLEDNSGLNSGETSKFVKELVAAILDGKKTLTEAATEMYDYYFDGVDEALTANLNREELIKSFEEKLNDELHKRNSFNQKVLEGEDALTVQAVSTENYYFWKWSDGVTSPTRKDLDVMADNSVTAIFIEVYIGGEGQFDPNAEPKPGDPTNSNNGEYDLNAPPTDNQNNGGGENEDDGPGGKGGGPQEETSQVIDGATYYGDKYAESYTDGTEGMKQNGNITQNEQDVANGYWDGIEK